MIRIFIKSEQGQTAIEYLLIMVVSISLGLTFLKKMDEYVLSNPQGLIGGPLNQFKSQLNQDPTGRYKTFPILLNRR